ncbi:MAG: hypothetical protein RL026_2643 [Pseudomonadota bacterium]|jgi:uncharacterized membrane protein (DUF4010 family)
MTPSILAGSTDLLTALGIGLMIGAVRERLHDPSRVSVSGVRTHAVVALVAVVAARLGPSALLAAMGIIGLLLGVSYWKTAEQDPGLTGEAALLATTVLAALAHVDALQAAAVAVIVAALLWAKQPVRRFVREVLTEREIQDALLLAGAALVVLPWLPTVAIDPFGALVPSSIWRLVVLVLAVGMAGHAALRAIGPRWGYAVAGFLAGFASSTAAVAGFGQRSTAQPAQWRHALAGALLANLASLGLLAGVVGVVSPALFRTSIAPLSAAALWLLVFSLPGLRPVPASAEGIVDRTARAFRLGNAVLLAGVMAGLLLLSAWLQAGVGPEGVLLAAFLVALAEIHAATVTLAELHAHGLLGVQWALWGLVGLLVATTVAKTLVAWVTGTRAYAAGLFVGLGGATAVAGGVVWISN